MQIRSVIVYSRHGEVRRVDFATGRLNVITGESKAGKSALLEIVRYCLGSDEFPVPAGVIADTVGWYAVVLSISMGELFVARQGPDGVRRATSQVMLRLAESVHLPSYEELAANTNLDGLRSVLDQSLGFGEVSVPLASTSVRRPFRIGVQHALFYCFQRQNEIANRDQLFHRQGEDYIPTTIRDTLPYFLGAVPEDYPASIDRLRRARSDLRRRVARLDAARDGSVDERALSESLITQAQQVGLLPREIAPEDREGDGVYGLLAFALTTAGLDAPEVLTASAAFDELLHQRDALRARHRALEESRLLLDRLVDGQRDYAQVLGVQAQLMSAVEYIPSVASHGECPACGRELETADPTSEVLLADLTSIRQLAEAASHDEPRLLRRQAQVVSDQQAVLGDLRRVDEQLDALGRQVEEVGRLQSRFNEQSYIRGKIDLHLQTHRGEEAEDDAEAVDRISALREEIERLERHVDYDNVRENVVSILNAIGTDVQRWARQLGLEYAEFPVRIDLANLTVVVDTNRGRIELTEVGSGHNWMGYHVAAHLALHQHFVEQNRPVPQFLFLDQPTQVFYPPGSPVDDTVALNDADRLAVGNLFQVLRDVTQELAPHFQVIVVDHENPDRPGQPTVVGEEWRNGVKLIPSDWLAR